MPVVIEDFVQQYPDTRLQDVLGFDHQGTNDRCLTPNDHSASPIEVPLEPTALDIFSENLSTALKRESVPKLDFNHAQNIWNSISGTLPADTPPPEDISEAFFNNSAIQNAIPVSEDEKPLVAVVGVGYVGIQLVTAFAEHYNVIAFDVCQKRMQELAPTLANYPSVSWTTIPGQLAGATHFLISVPTTLLPDKRIDTSFLQSAIYTVGLYARPNATVVVESSVSVGMTRRLLSQLMHVRGLKAGMSPEVRSHVPHAADVFEANSITQRVDPGRTDPPFASIPKIISGLDTITPNSLHSIQQLYSRVFTTLIPVSSPEVAEMTKLYENCQRMLNIAYANEMADACTAHSINPYEVCRAAATKPFGYVPFTPGLGVGGHCIPVNPYYLLSNCDFPLLKAATERMWNRPARVGDAMMQEFLMNLTTNQSPSTPLCETLELGNCQLPDHLVDGKNNNNSSSSSIKRTHILVVGVGFKRGQSTLSHSPAVSLIRHLLDQWNAHVTFADPLVPEEALPYIPKLDDVNGEWDRAFLEEHFQLIVVALRQVGLDFGVLNTLDKAKVRVVEFC